MSAILERLRAAKNAAEVQHFAKTVLEGALFSNENLNEMI